MTDWIGPLREAACPECAGRRLNGLRFAHKPDCGLYAQVLQADAADGLEPGRLLSEAVGWPAYDVLQREPTAAELALAAALGWQAADGTTVVIDGAVGRKRFQPPSGPTFDPSAAVGGASADPPHAESTADLGHGWPDSAAPQPQPQPSQEGPSA